MGVKNIDATYFNLAFLYLKKKSGVQDEELADHSGVSIDTFVGFMKGWAEGWIGSEDGPVRSSIAQYFNTSVAEMIALGEWIEQGKDPVDFEPTEEPQLNKMTVDINLNECLQRLKLHFSIITDKELARKIGITSANLSNYRNGEHRSFPYKWIIEVARVNNLSVDWVLFGELPTLISRRVIDVTAFHLSLSHFLRSHGEATRLARHLEKSTGYVSEIASGTTKGAEDTRRAIAEYFGFDYEEFLSLGEWILNGNNPDEFKSMSGDTDNLTIAEKNLIIINRSCGNDAKLNQFVHTLLKDHQIKRS